MILTNSSKKHPEAFSSVDDVVPFVEYVLERPTHKAPGMLPTTRLLARRNGKDKAVAIEIENRGGSYMVKSAYILRPGQMKKKIEKAIQQGGRSHLRSGELPHGEVSDQVLAGLTNPASAKSPGNIVDSPSSESNISQTNTPEFRRWFGDSVVTHNGKPMSEGGKPLVVYHGTGNDFTIFKPLSGEILKGLRTAETDVFYFADNPDIAASYSGITSIKRDSRRFDTPWSPSILPVYLSMKNPYIKDFKGGGYDPATFDSIIRGAKGAGYDGVIFKNILDPGYKRNGYENSKTFVPHTQYAVFSPTQIKSATGNRGTFDPENPDIRESRVREI